MPDDTFEHENIPESSLNEHFRLQQSTVSIWLEHLGESPCHKAAEACLILLLSLDANNSQIKINFITQRNIVRLDNIINV